MSLPATFKKIGNCTQNTNNPADNAKQGGSGNNKEGKNVGRKKRTSDNKNGNLIRNMPQEDNFKVTAGKTRKKHL
jgi:hypothetical protein